MYRNFALATAVTLATSFAANAQPVPPSTPYPVIKGKTYQFEKVADGVYYATGGLGSNNVVIVNDADVHHSVLWREAADNRLGNMASV